MNLINKLFKRVKIYTTDVSSIAVPEGYVCIQMTSKQFDDHIKFCRDSADLSIKENWTQIHRMNGKRFHIYSGVVIEEILDNEPTRETIPSYN